MILYETGYERAEEPHSDTKYMITGLNPEFFSSLLNSVCHFETGSFRLVSIDLFHVYEKQALRISLISKYTHCIVIMFTMSPASLLSEIFSNS